MEMNTENLSMRALASIRRVSEIRPIEGADKIEIAVVDGWQCVVKKNEFAVDSLAVYCEIDSWIPTNVAPFLTRPGHHPKEFEGVQGERLKTVKLRGQLSQGLLLPREVLIPFFTASNLEEMSLNEGTDVTELLDIKKWEKPLAANLQGKAKGYFPTFIRKTDQERIQNIFKDLTPEQISDTYEVTLKLDGSSCTFFYNNGEVGVCSRNLQLKTGEENTGNAFVDMFNKLNMCAVLVDHGKNIAIQGELYGSGINGNWEGLSDHHFRVFDIWDIDAQSYMSAGAVWTLCAHLGLMHVPLREKTTLEKFATVQDFLDYAVASNIHNKIAEGFVFKSLTNPNFSFKVINNEFLLKGGE